MFSSRFNALVVQNKNTWKAGLAIVVAGVTFKVTYFNFSRGLMVDHMDQRHIQAIEHLKDRRDLAGQWQKEREEKAPPLTSEQKEQLQEYLQLMKASQPDVYPNESGRFSR